MTEAFTPRDEIEIQVVCRDEQDRYLTVPAPPQSKFDLELPSGQLTPSQNEDLPTSESPTIVSMSGYDVQLGPELDDDPAARTRVFLGRLAGGDLPTGARWIYPTVVDRLAERGQVSPDTSARIAHADTRINW